MSTDELLRKLERAACAGDEMAARELGQRRATCEGLTTEQRVEALVRVRFAMVMDYHTEWTPSISELAGYGLRVWEAIQPIVKGDKARIKRLAERLFIELAPDQAASLNRRREHARAFKPVREWIARVRVLMHGQEPRFTRNEDGTYSREEPPPFDRDDVACEAEINNVPVVLGFEETIQNIRAEFIRDLERQT